MDNLEVTAFIRDRETVRRLAANFGEDLPPAGASRAGRACCGAPDAGRRARLVSPLM